VDSSVKGILSDSTELRNSPGKRNSPTNTGDHNNDFLDKNGYSWDYALVLPVPAAMQERNKVAREKKKKKIYTELYVTSKRYATVHVEETLNRDIQGKNAYVYIYMYVCLHIYIYIYIYTYVYIYKYT
jgi:hypothetical protein